MTAPAIAPNHDSRGKRRSIFFAVLAGLCPLIPLPFIDDIALEFVRKQLLTSLFAAYQIELTPAHLAALLQTEKSNRLVGCLVGIVLYPIKKIFRKIFFVLSVKDCVDSASVVLHEGLLVRHALATGLVDRASLDAGPETLLALNRAIRATCKQTDTRPVNQVFRRAFTASRSALADAAATLASLIRNTGASRKNPQPVQAAFERAEQQPNPQVDHLVDAIGGQVFTEPGYLDAIEKRFESNFRRERSA
jgi:uncharacterized protein (DUF697 family)